MYDCDTINTPFYDFESLEFSTKKKYSDVLLWLIEIVYKCGKVESKIITASEIEVNVNALHLRVCHDVLTVKYTELDVQKII